MDFKEIIKSLRKNKGYSADYVAEQIDIPAGSYKKYESGILNPGVPVVLKLADFYGVTTDYLLGREPPEPKVITPNDEELEEALLEAYRTMPDDARKDFLNHIREAVLAERSGGIYVTKTIGEFEDERRIAEEACKKDKNFA